MANGSSGNSISTNSIFIGVDSRSSIASQTNQIVIGYQAIGGGDNSVTLGNTSNTGLFYYGTLRPGGTSAPTAGMFLKAATSSTNAWATITTSDISGISSYLTTATAASTYMPIVTGTLAQVLTIDENGNRNFMSLDHKPLKLNVNEIAVGNEFGLLESRGEFKYLNSLMNIGHKTDTSKYTSFGMTTPTSQDGLIKVFGGGSLHLDGVSVKVNHLGGSTVFERIVTVDQNGYLSAKVLDVAGNISQGLDSVLGVSEIATNRNILLKYTGSSSPYIGFLNSSNVATAFLSLNNQDNELLLQSNLENGIKLFANDGDITLDSALGNLTLGRSSATSEIILSGTSFKLHLSNNFSGGSVWGNLGSSSTPQNGDMALLTFDSGKGAFVLCHVKKNAPQAYNASKSYLTAD